MGLFWVALGVPGYIYWNRKRKKETRTAESDDRDRLIQPFDLDPAVVFFQDFLVGRALLGHPVGPDLAEADAVSPALSRKQEMGDAAVLVDLAVDDEKVVPEVQDLADLQPGDADLAFLADDRRAR